MATMTEVRNHVEQLLFSLPSDPDKIATRLATSGIRGYRGKPRACPLGLWLLAACDELENVAITYGVEILLVDGGRIAIVDWPPSVGTFVRNFDEGKYPVLIGEATP
jgi:hypothetical protein